jgi:hypothetical protein
MDCMFLQEYTSLTVAVRHHASSRDQDLVQLQEGPGGAGGEEDHHQGGLL